MGLRVGGNYGFSQGYMTLDMPDERTRECATMTCGHCNFVTKIKPMSDPAEAGGLCKTCMRLICKGCAGKFRCDPIENKLERAEARGEALRSYGL